MIRNKYEAAKEELQRQKAGSSLELQSMQEEVGTLKRALENAEHDKIQGERALRQEKEMKEAIERSAELLKGRAQRGRTPQQAVRGDAPHRRATQVRGGRNQRNTLL